METDTKPRRLRLKEELLLALLPTATVLLTMGLVEKFGRQHLLCACIERISDLSRSRASNQRLKFGNTVNHPESLVVSLCGFVDGLGGVDAGFA